MDEPQNDIKLIAFDVEGTLLKNDLWTRLHPLFKVSEAQDYEWYSLYKSGVITFREWLQMISDTWMQNPVSRDEILQELTPLNWNDSAREVVGTLMTKYRLAVVSSGIDIFVLDAASQLSITDAYFFNTLEFDDKEVFKQINFPVAGSEVEAKVSALRELSEKYAIPLKNMAFVGDSKNDLGAFECTEHGILYGIGTHEMQRAAWRQINYFSELLTIF